MNITHPEKYSFLRSFYQLTLVNILSSIIVPLAGFIGIVFLGHLTEIHHLAGASLAIILFDCIYFCLNFLRWVTTGMTAIAVGQNDEEAILLVGVRNALIALVIGILILILHYPLGYLAFDLFNVTVEVKNSGLAYFNARIWGAPAVLLNYVLVGWLLGQRQSGKALIMTIVFNIANIVQDYFYVIRWDWASTGAGLSSSVSQYLMLLIGIILVSREVSFKRLRTLGVQLRDLPAFQSTLSMNGNLFVRSLAIAFTYAIFSSVSTTMGTTNIAVNSLLLQVVLLTVDIFHGIGLTTTTLSGIFEGGEANSKSFPLLQIAVGTSLLIGLTCAGVSVLFPQTIFGLLTNHTEIIGQIKIYVPWLLIVLGCGSIALILEGYLTGTTKGYILRNALLISTLLGFVPSAILAWHYQSNHILWLAMSMFMTLRIVIPGIYIFMQDAIAVKHL
ncbi:putative efflux protein, MATE family (plasmid) [Cylindrospermum stagnale PCC 7417]|uniref:Putative efflux protein, MATE family n=1 Tax=Cylindrospermum stagnale PCC 7417 TaxID=56107 RepID=K9X828_9NOST|nr:guanitoxin biosynthesis MATE family efflux transporter GntT [Cylindrospermum stagnale]AFZ28264.1 putative efflux protein, MATE family [Cylindrospermum stagnale PCC 7417]